MINMLTCINCGTNVGARLAGRLFEVSWKFRTVSQILKAIIVQERECFKASKTVIVCIGFTLTMGVN